MTGGHLGVHVAASDVVLVLIGARLLADGVARQQLASVERAPQRSLSRSPVRVADRRSARHPPERPVGAQERPAARTVRPPAAGRCVHRAASQAHARASRLRARRDTARHHLAVPERSRPRDTASEEPDGRDDRQRDPPASGGPAAPATFVVHAATACWARSDREPRRTARTVRRRRGDRTDARRRTSQARRANARAVRHRGDDRSVPAVKCHVAADRLLARPRPRAQPPPRTRRRAAGRSTTARPTGTTPRR